jgi:glycosyltransferase involved in cell wall biosynthesis
MRLLYVSATYAPGAYSGSELSAHNLLRQLAISGRAEVRVLTDCRYTNGLEAERVFEGVVLRGVSHETRVTALQSEVDAFRPSAILTQLIWSDIALRVAVLRGVPSLLRVPSLPLGLDVSVGSSLHPTALIAPTEFTQQAVAASSARRPFVVRSAIDVTRALVGAGEWRPRFVTMFNPVDIKGGTVFHEIARRMPDRLFAAVSGWNVLRRADGGWDRALLRRAAESLGFPDEGWTPRDEDFSDVPNVTVLAPRDSVHEIYAMTRILLVPSQWAEVHGRVTVEASANGIPVVASAVGGLGQHVARAGIVVDRFADPDAWVAAIARLDDAATYADCAKRGRKVAAEYSLPGAIDQFCALLARVVAAPPGASLDAP